MALYANCVQVGWSWVADRVRHHLWCTVLGTQGCGPESALVSAQRPIRGRSCASPAPCGRKFHFLWASHIRSWKKGEALVNAEPKSVESLSRELGGANGAPAPQIADGVFTRSGTSV